MNRRDDNALISGAPTRFRHGCVGGVLTSAWCNGTDSELFNLKYI